MQPAKRNYEIYNKELLTIVKAKIEAIFTRYYREIQSLD